MTKRTEHLFQFTGKQISEAARGEHEYHERRLSFWEEQHTLAIAAAKEKGLEVSEYPVTGGVRAQMTINPTLQERINESANKLKGHAVAADRFKIEAACYGSQAERTYELHPDDVIYFRLAGGPRQD